MELTLAAFIQVIAIYTTGQASICAVGTVSHHTYNHQRSNSRTAIQSIRGDVRHDLSLSVTSAFRLFSASILSSLDASYATVV